jgi:hypothetical protein
MPEYQILNAPLLARNFAASRLPRLQPSVPAEYGDMVSREVAMGDWSVDPSSGEPINSKGQSVTDHLETTLQTRPHWLLPVEKEDPASDTWTSGSLTKIGARLKQLRAFTGSDAAAQVLLAEEAAHYVDPATGQPLKPFSTVQGVKPEDRAANEKGTRNPYSPASRGNEERRMEKILALIKSNAKLAASLAKSAGMRIDGSAIPKK